MTDLYFRERNNAEQFRDFYLSFTGRECPKIASCDYFNASTNLNNIDKNIYPFTLNNYVENDIVEVYLALFPEEEDV
jgi:hypothetical protein